MQLIPAVNTYPPALAAADPFESITSFSALTELEELIDLELQDESPVGACFGFPIGNGRIEREAELLRQRELSSDLRSWVDGYNSVGSRTPYLWTWCRQGAEATTLPCVLESRLEELCDTKVIGMMFDVLLDDVADQGGDAEFLEDLVALVLSDNPSDWRPFTDGEQQYAAFSEAVWNELQRRVRRFPRYNEFADLLHFDYLQLMNTMRYAHFLNRFPCFLNLAEHDLYQPHNMMMMICATMDLMCSPEFDFSEIGRLRQAIWHAQHMGRIGNLVTTWEREIREADFTSGVFAHAVIHGSLTPEQLAEGDRDEIENTIRAGQHEEYFLYKWREHRRQLLALQPSLRSVDLGRVVHGLDRLICLHFASRGLK